MPESELLTRIASLEEQLKKPMKFIQGCTDERAINYNSQANLDDNSCNTLDTNTIYIRFHHHHLIHHYRYQM